jgi:Rieske Fe-S protein
MERFTRRTFIKLTTAFAGVLALSPLRRIVAADDVEWVSVGSIDDFDDGKPELIKKGPKTPVIVFRQGDSVSAVSAKCTHKGCTVGVKKNGIYACPCHGAQFDYEGVVQKGPAKENLPKLMAKVSDAGEVMIGV